MKIEIWSDIVCPWCYLGKVRLERALERFAHRDAVEIVHRSFELDPTIQPGERHDVVSTLAVKKGASEDQVREMMASVERVAATDGLLYHLEEAGTGNTLDAHRLVALAADRGMQDEMLTRLYRAHFTEARSVFHRDSLLELAVEAGLDEADAVEVLDGGAYKDRVADDQALARSIGITGVPFFVIDRKYGVSGAQSSDALLEALEQIWAESNPLQNIAADAQVCADGVCY